jgi:hypothetical protein
MFWEASILTILFFLFKVALAVCILCVAYVVLEFIWIVFVKRPYRVGDDEWMGHIR